MPANVNKVFILGNLTRDPELRYIPSGQAVTSFSVAVNRTYNARSGERKTETDFLRVVTWGKQAENCNQYLRKGSSVFVEGRLQGRSWQAQDGTKRTTMEIVAQNVQFLSKSTRTKQSENGDAGNNKEETIIDDSFTPNSENRPMRISPDKLSPDNEVPF